METLPPIKTRAVLHRTTLAHVPTEAEGFDAKALADRIDRLVREGNVRRIVVHDRTGRTVLDVPVLAGLVAAVFAPMITAASAGLALAGGWRLEVERTEPMVVEERPDERADRAGSSEEDGRGRAE